MLPRILGSPCREPHMTLEKSASFLRGLSFINKEFKNEPKQKREDKELTQTEAQNNILEVER